MKTSVYIKSTIDKLPKGFVFTYENFNVEAGKNEAVIKALNRMAAAGNIVKLSKGKFYKPEETPFGTLKPRQSQIVKDLLEKDGKIIGYLTGLGMFNQLRLTTQVSNVIQIGRNEAKPAIKREFYKIEFLKQKNTITKENIPLLQLLDAIRYIKMIPDTDMATRCNRLKALLRELDEKRLNTLIRLSLKYSPATRALLGALLEDLFLEIDLRPLQNSLNPISVYKLGISSDILPTTINWKIK